jgi:hypothetical protein
VSHLRSRVVRRQAQPDSPDSKRQRPRREEERVGSVFAFPAVQSLGNRSRLVWSFRHLRRGLTQRLDVRVAISCQTRTGGNRPAAVSRLVGDQHFPLPWRYPA